MEIFKKTKIKFFIILILIISIGLVNTKKVDAFAAVVSDPGNTTVSSINAGTSAVTSGSVLTDTAISIKNVAKEVLKQIGMSLARKAFQGITESTINWINTGNFDNPLFLENPESFFKDIVKYEVRNIIDTLGYDSLRFPFGRDFALNTIYTYKQTLAENAQYSLSKVIQDPVLVKNFRDDFGVGGWEGFLLHTQYPQNNPIGFQMVATEELSNKLRGIQQNSIQKVNNALAQGQGFLSTETCQTNANYNNVANQFKQPKWNQSEYYRDNPYNPPDVIGEDGTDSEYQAYIAEYDAKMAEERSKWEGDNTCPNRADGSSGFVTTTPGSTIANAAMEAMGASKDNALIAMTTGSLSAIFDALLSKLLGEGLSALATTQKTNPGPKDDWDYEGNTLGTTLPYNSTTSDWTNMPDEVITVSGFKKDIEDGILRTTQEITMIDNVQKIFNEIWKKTRELDQCIPGPDILWQDRLEEEGRRVGLKFSQAESSNNGTNAATARLAHRQLNYAVGFFKDWVENQMMTVLPSSVDYIETVESLDSIYQTSSELVNKKRVKVQTLARLKAIQLKLAIFTSDPTPGSQEEDELIDLRKQYRATQGTIANVISIEDVRNEFNVAQDQLKNLYYIDPQTEIKTGKVIECTLEREAAGWSAITDQYGLGKSTGTDSQGRTGTERELFCDFPIAGGFSHGEYEWTFGNRTRLITLFNQNTTPAEYPDPDNGGLPVVNTTRAIYSWLFSSLPISTKIDIQCSIVFKANVLDYKQDIPGITGPIMEIPAGTEGGQCIETGYKYAGELRQAMDAVIAANPSVANLPNIEDNSSGRGMKANAKQFLDLVAAYVNSNMPGYNATADVLNGNNNTSTGDIIAIWRDNDTLMERYDAIAGNDTITVGQASQTIFAGFIPLNCTNSGGGTDCGCQTEEVPGPSACSAGKGNDTGAPNSISNINWIDTDIEGWSVTSNLSSVNVSNDAIQLNHSKAGAWPIVDWGNTPPADVEGNAWIIAWRGGRWQAATFDWLRPGQTEKSLDNIMGADGTLRGALGDFSPKAGELYGFAVSTPARNSVRSTNERTNVYTMRWPTGITCPDGGPTNPPGPTPGPTPTPGNAFISSVSPTTAQPGVTTITISGSNLTNQVSFYDGGGGRNTVVGSVNAAKTQTTVLVPAEQPIGNATVKIYQGNQIWSNGKLIAISNNAPTPTVKPSFNATSGWGGNLAHNPTNNTWLIVSSGTTSGGTYGRIMNNNGTPASPQITITAADSGTPKVAYAPDINKYLVVWLQWDDANTTSVSEVRGRFINADGTFSGNNFLIHTDASYPNDASTAYSNSTMQYDLKNKKFVYVWQTGDSDRSGNSNRRSNLITIGNNGVVGSRINLTSSFTKVAGDDGRGDPAIAIKESSNEYCVIYQRGYSSPGGTSGIWNASIRARAVNALTGVVGPETVIYSESSSNATVVLMSIVYNPINNKYLVGWTGAGTAGAKGKFMTSCNGSTAGATFTINSKASGHGLAYNLRSNQYASIGQNPNDSGNTYVILNSNGAKVSEGVAFTGGYGNFAPSITANTTDGTFAATSSLEYGTTRFAPNLGTVLGGGSGTVTNPIKKDLGVGTFPDPVFYNGRIYVAVQQGTKLNLYNWDKNLGDQKLQQIAFSGVGQAFQRLTVYNNILWMVFRDGDNSPGSSVPESIKLWRSDTGTIENLGQVTNSGNDPVAAGNGYVAWQNQVSGVIKVLRRSLTGGSVTTVRNGAPTGISRILTNGSVVLIDTDRNAVSWGVNAWFAGVLTVAADITPKDDNGVVGRFNNLSSTEFNIWLNERTHTPHAATDGAGNYVIATWNPTVRIATFNRP